MRVLVLAGGFDQIALIQELKKRGCYVVLVDYYENPPAKQFADKHIVASTLDVDKVECIAKVEQVGLICTACTDQALLTVAYVSERLGLPCYISYQTGLKVTNKLYMKDVFVKNDIPTSKYVIVTEPNINSIKGFSYPLVVKPVDCNSSKGVKRVDNDNDYVSFVKDAINYSRTRTAIVEEYKEGTEISADFYVDHGEAKFLSATTSLKIKNKNSFTILGSDYPAVDCEQHEKLIAIASSISRAFALDNTPLLIQLIANKDELSVLEFSARMGGGSKYRLIQILSGVNIMSTYVDRILGGLPTVNPVKQVDYCKLMYLYCKPGVFDHVEGFDELVSEGYIDAYFVYKTKGMAIHGAETSGDRPAGYLCTSSGRELLNQKVKVIDSRLKVFSKDGDDIMLHGLL